MITYERLSNGQYKVFLPKTVKIIDRITGHQLKKGLTKLMKNDRMIILDLRHVENLNIEGFKKIEEILLQAEKRGTHIIFKNLQSPVRQKLITLSIPGKSPVDLLDHSLSDN